ncbi:hypothetical protein K4W68_10400, partial [Pseudomonas aeruginosa]|nr:hypothetical protein [Pseudomonas aeruginosa]
TRLLDEKEEPGGTLAYINGALLSLLSDALSEIEAGHPSLSRRYPARRPRPGRGLCGIAHHKTFRARTARLIAVPVLAKRPPIA